MFVAFTSLTLPAQTITPVPLQRDQVEPGKAVDQVLEWNAIMNDTVIAGATNPLATTRVVALVSGSVFDAVNGVNPRYRYLFVKPHAAWNASPRAAAIQSAYAMLMKLYSTQGDALTAKRDASIAALAPEETAKSIQAGVDWGQSVADSIWAWRLTDGIAPPPPPFVGVLGIEGSSAAVGVWRPTPTANLPGAAPQFATRTSSLPLFERSPTANPRAG